VSGVADLGPLARSAIPADVRRAGAQAEQRYAAALSFERTLTAELTKALSTGALGDSDAATAAYRDMLPGTLADALAQAGGLGLARGLYDAMEER
jgi:Rod binding domain-containing protein